MVTNVRGGIQVFGRDFWSGFRLSASGLRLSACGFRLPAFGCRLAASGLRTDERIVRPSEAGYFAGARAAAWMDCVGSSSPRKYLGLSFEPSLKFAAFISGMAVKGLE